VSFENYNELQSYDSLNPFLVRGAPAPDIQNLMFDTLMQRSWDELASEYALIADDVEVAPDLTSATFHINPAARFSNGDPITAADVKYSFDTLTSPQASPLFNAQFSIIKSATVVDKMTIRFDFKRAERDAPLIAGDLPVFSPKWGMTADGKRPPFDQIAATPPIASGAYLITQRKNDKDIEYVRNPELLGGESADAARHVPLRAHPLQAVSGPVHELEAFKAGDADVKVEYSATQWARKYVGKNFKSGLLKQVNCRTARPRCKAFLINMRKPMFKDVRVRHALALAFDYDWMNRMMFYGQYVRLNSYFDASPFGATGMPGQKELPCSNRSGELAARSVRPDAEAGQHAGAELAARQPDRSPRSARASRLALSRRRAARRQRHADDDRDHGRPARHGPFDPAVHAGARHTRDSGAPARNRQRAV
jgi:microcin C transport system substrate-binding protein